MELRAWLRQHPQPARVRAIVDGDERIVRIGSSRSKWRDAEDALRSAESAEALDADGAILRVWTAEDQDPAAPPTAAAPGRERELAMMARIIADASDRAALRHAEAYRLAYEQQCLLVQLLAERLAALERAWQRILMERGEEPPNLDALALGVIGRAMGLPAQSPQKENGAR